MLTHRDPFSPASPHPPVGRRGLRRNRAARRSAAPLAAVMLCVFGLLGWRAPSAQAEELLVDISQHLVAITTGFTGADVLLFGVREGPGEIVVVVRGPHMSTTVRRKDRIAGIWRSEEHTAELQSLMR